MLPLKNRTKRLYLHFNLSTKLLKKKKLASRAPEDEDLLNFDYSLVSYETYLADKYLKRKGFEKGFEKTYFPPQFLLKFVNNF